MRVRLLNTREIKRFIQNQVYTINGIYPDDGFDDLSPLSEIMENARIIAVGEGAHFMKEFWTIRQRLFKYFHQRHGFDIFAMEFGFAEGFTLRKWINGEGSENSLESYSKAAAEWGAADTMKWLRQYNERQGFTINFAGIDIPEAAGDLLPALLPFYEYVEKVEPALCAELEEAIAISGKFAGLSAVVSAYKWKELPEREQCRLTAILNKVYLRLQSLKPCYINRSSVFDYEAALHELRAAICADYMIRSTADSTLALPLDMSVRECFMADMAMWHLKNSPCGKIFLIAHNNHIQKTPVAYGEYQSAIPMGYYLKQRLGDDYRCIALTSSDDHIAEMKIDVSLPVGFKVLDVPLENPVQGSFNAFLEDNGLAKEITFTDLRAPSGIDFSAIRSQSAYVTTSVKEAFDGVINLPNVSIDKTVFLNKG